MIYAARRSLSKKKKAVRSWITRFKIKCIIVAGTLTLMTIGSILSAAGALLAIAWSRISDKPFLFTLNIYYLTEGTTYAVILVLVSIVGCMACSCDWNRGLPVYLTGVLISIAHHAVLVFFLCSLYISETKVEIGLTELLSVYNEGSKAPPSQFINVLFSRLECCGITDYRKDLKSADFKNTLLRAKVNIAVNSSIPFTCCKDYDWLIHTISMEGLHECLDHTSAENAYIEGCADRVLNLAFFVSVCSLVLVLFTGLVQIILGCLAIRLFMNIDL